MNGRLLRAVFVATFAALVAVAWATWRADEAPDPSAVVARPALWKATKGDSELWLLGTIHVLPKGERWLSPAVAEGADRSDRLFLEVTGLDAERRSRAVFERLGRSDGLPPIEARLAPQQREQYQSLLKRHGASLRQIDQYDSWAAALLINAAVASSLSLSAAEAGEAVLGREFDRAGKPVLGLETIDQQLGAFDRLPETEQRRLLTLSVEEAADAPALYKILHEAWAAGDIDKLEQRFLAPLAEAPVLGAVLVDDRNARWARTLDEAMAARPGRAFVAVGAGHLLGERGLQAQLATLGWSMKRIQ